MSKAAPLCVIIPSWNGWHLLQDCLNALDRQTVRPAQIIVVDNGSQDETVEQVGSRWPQVRMIVLRQNEGFAGGCNRGIEAADAGLDVVLLNNDACPRPGWLEQLERAAGDLPDSVGVLSAKMIGSDGLIDSTGDFLTSWGMAFQRGHGERDNGQYDRRTQIFSGCGGASLYRRAMLEDVGVFDEAFFAYYEDVDLCFRARLAGWDVRLVPAAVVVHEAGATSGRMHGFRRYHATRNLWFLVLKNVPSRLLPAMLVRVALLQGWWLLGAARHRQLGVALRAHLHAGQRLRELVRQRRLVQARRSIPVEDVARWLPRRRADLRVSAPDVES